MGSRFWILDFNPKPRTQNPELLSSGWGLRDVCTNWQQLGHALPVIDNSKTNKTFQLILLEDSIAAESSSGSGAQSGAQSGEILKALMQAPLSMNELVVVLQLKSKTGSLKRTILARSLEESVTMGVFFESIKCGLEEAIAHSKGDKTEVRLFIPEEVNVKQVREKTGLSQSQFASTFGISLGTLRHWERGDRRPHGPALVLLNAAKNAPDELLRILTGRIIEPVSQKKESNRSIRTKMAA